MTRGSPPPALRPLDLAVALGLLLAGVLLRLPLIGLGETVDEALDPLLEAIALRDHLQVRHPGFFHFGYGRGLSHLPFVLGVDGLVDAQTRRSLVQALLGPMAFLAGRKLSGRVLGPGLAALILVTSEELLQTGVSGHETYLAGEWVAAALLALAWGPGRGPAVALGAALAMAVMNHPFALPALALLSLHPRRRLAVGTLGIVLLPQIVRVAAALTSGIGIGRVLLVRPVRPADVVAVDYADFFRGGAHADVLLLLLAPLLLILAARSGSAPRAWARAAAIGWGAAAAEVLLVGWSEGWYWRPTAPWMAVCLGLAIAPRGTAARAAAALAAVVVCAASVDRTDAAYERTGEGLRYADHVSALGRALQARRDEGPFALLGLAADDGVPRRAAVWPVAVDRMLAGRVDVLSADPRAWTDGPLLLHLEGPPEALIAATDAAPEAERVVEGRAVRALVLPHGSGPAAARRAFEAAVDGPVLESDPARLRRALDPAAAVSAP